MDRGGLKNLGGRKCFHRNRNNVSGTETKLSFRKLFRDSRKDECSFIELISTLYSFRMRTELLKYESLVNDATIKFSAEGHLSADEADVLSKILFWLGKHNLALQVATKGLEIATTEYKTGTHTSHLLRLTRIEAMMAVFKERGIRHTDFALEFDRIHTDMDLIENMEQRARVYRGLGTLYRKIGARVRGWKYGYKAVFPGDPIPFNVRIKGIGALVLTP